MISQPVFHELYMNFAKWPHELLSTSPTKVTPSLIFLNSNRAAVLYTVGQVTLGAKWFLSRWELYRAKVLNEHRCSQSHCALEMRLHTMKTAIFRREEKCEKNPRQKTKLERSCFETEVERLERSWLEVCQVPRVFAWTSDHYLDNRTMVIHELRTQSSNIAYMTLLF